MIALVKRKTYSIVKIVWMDAEADPAWKTEQEIAAELVGSPVVSVGFLLRKPTKTFPMYMLAATATQSGEEIHFNNTMKIPKHWVKSLSTIVEDYVLWQLPEVTGS